MKRLTQIVAVAALAGCALAAQDPTAGRGFLKVRVMHADPYFVKSMLEGLQTMQPELSTVLGFAGVPDKESALIQSIFGTPGRLVVNPTDNSILFIPDPKK